MGPLGDSPTKMGPVKRTIAKLRLKGHDDSSEQQQHGNDATHNTHAMTEDYTTSVAYALIREVFQYLNSAEAQIAIRNIVITEAKVAANLAVSEGAKEASRTAARQAVLGSYDAAESKYLEMWEKLPVVVKATAIPILAIYLLALGMALLFSLCRFALFGMN